MSARRTRTSRGSSTTRRAARTRRITSRRSGAIATRAASTTAGTSYREQTFARQKQLGVIPADAELTPRNEAFPAWDSVPEAQRPLLARQMEVFAGLLENADWNVGRVLDAIEAMGELENTLVIYIPGDNGASMEGSGSGTFNELTMQNGIVAERRAAARADRPVRRPGGVGRRRSWRRTTRRRGRGRATCPFQWGKQVASHLGGTRDPMVVSWPRGIAERGGLRSQFTHVIDIGPTILEAAGIPAPTQHRRDRADADPRHQLPLQLDGRRRARAPHPAVLRDLRQPRDVQGRLAGLLDAAAHPLGRHAGDDEEVRARRLGPRRPIRPSCTTCPTTSPRRATSPPSTPRRSPSCGSCSGRRPRSTCPAAAGRVDVLLRHRAAARRAHHLHVPRPGAERGLGDDPADLQPLLRHQRRSGDPGRAARKG